MPAEVYEPKQGRYGVKCDECDWTHSVTSTSSRLAMGDAVKHNDEKHNGFYERGDTPEETAKRAEHWYTRSAR